MDSFVSQIQPVHLAANNVKSGIAKCMEFPYIPEDRQFSIKLQKVQTLQVP